jgi:glycerol-3-phosphate acyltransferase PlsX
MRIAVDVMGGDHGPAVVIGGVALALANQPGISELLLVGQSSEIEAGLNTPVAATNVSRSSMPPKS